MTSHSDEPSRTGMGWLVPPDLPSGVNFQIGGLLEAEQLSPEAIGLLAKLMAELQQAAKILANKACPKLSTCQEFTGDCSKLEYCGTYKVKAAVTL